MASIWIAHGMTQQTAQAGSSLFKMDQNYSTNFPTIKDQSYQKVTQDNAPLSALSAIYVRGFRLEGNTFLSIYDQNISSILSLFKLKDSSYDALKQKGMTQVVIERLYPLKGLCFISEDQFIRMLEKCMDPVELFQFRPIILEHAAVYPNQMITAEEMHAIAFRLTQYYVQKGFINSVVIIPNQRVKDGIVTLRIIEGELTQISITGLTHLKPAYILDQMPKVVELIHEPLDINELETRLNQVIPLLKLDKRIQAIQARLGPGIKPGESKLTIHVQEAKPYVLAFDINNYRSPGIGGYCGEIYIHHMNLSGHGDALAVSYAHTEGLDDYYGAYAFPFPKWQGILTLGADRKTATVVSEPFDMLNIETQKKGFFASFRWPLYRSLYREFAMELKFERNESQTKLLDRTFPFAGSDDNGETVESVLRCSHEWISRSKNQTITIRSTASFGLDILDATRHLQNDTDDSTAIPDGCFSTWLLQFQWLRYQLIFDSQLLARSNIRFSNDPLIPIEKFPIGGVVTVRGYRENRLTTDNARTFSLEWRVPLGKLPIKGISRHLDDGLVMMSPFFDYATGSNTKALNPETNTLYSIGMGFQWHITKGTYAELYWGKALADIDDPFDSDIQDDGIHFKIRSEIF